MNEMVTRNGLCQLTCRDLIPCEAKETSSDTLFFKVDPYSGKPLNLKNFLPFLNMLQHLMIHFGYLITATPLTYSYYFLFKIPKKSCITNRFIYKMLLELLPDHLICHASYIPYLHDSKIQSITSLTLEPTQCNDLGSCIHPLMAQLKKQCYSILFLATPIHPCCYYNYSNTLCNIYDDFFPLKERSLTSTQTTTQNRNSSKGESHTHTQASNCTQNTNHTKARTHSELNNSGLSLSSKPKTELSLNHNQGNNCTQTLNHSDSQSHSQVESNQQTHSQNQNQAQTHIETSTQSEGKKVYSRNILRLLTETDAMLERCEAHRFNPMFQTGVYFLSEPSGLSVQGACYYEILLQNHSTKPLKAYKNTWCHPPDCIDTLKAYLCHLCHPAFDIKGHATLSALPLSSKELYKLIKK